MKNKRAAMFGLDARIALAIFGALSVITGAALYSAIQNAKVTALLTEFEEFSKAYDAYFLDVGKEIPVSAPQPPYLKIEELVSSTEKGWKGPYLSYTTDGTEHTLGDVNYGDGAVIGEFLDGNWVSTLSSDLHKYKCDTGSIGGGCFMWLSFYYVPDFDLVKGLDKKVDGSVDGKTGKVRWASAVVSSKTVYYVFLKFRTQIGK